VLPSTKSAAFSAIIMVGAYMFPLVMPAPHVRSRDHWRKGVRTRHDRCIDNSQALQLQRHKQLMEKQHHGHVTCSPWTRMLVGSTTAKSSASVAILHVHVQIVTKTKCGKKGHAHDGWYAVSPSRFTHSKISSRLRTAGPGDVSPPLNSLKAGCLKISRAF
jgi:hypothetical protein